MQRAHESHGYTTSSGLLNLATIFVTLIKLTNFLIFFVIYQSRIFKTMGYYMIDVLKTKNALNEWNID